MRYEHLPKPEVIEITDASTWEEHFGQVEFKHTDFADTLSMDTPSLDNIIIRD